MRPSGVDEVVGSKFVRPVFFNLHAVESAEGVSF